MMKGNDKLCYNLWASDVSAKHIPHCHGDRANFERCLLERPPGETR